MKILFLTNALAFGGLEAYIFTLARALNVLGHETGVVATKIERSAALQGTWCGLTGAITQLPDDQPHLENLREAVRVQGIDLVVTSPPMRSLGDPEPYDLGCPEVCILHSVYSAGNWRPNGRKVFCNDETLSERYGGELLPVPCDLDRYPFRPDGEREVMSAGRWTLETLQIAREARRPLDFYGIMPAEYRFDGPILGLPASPLEQVFRRYRVCLGAGMVAVEAMASGCLTLVGQDTVRPTGGVGGSFEGLMTEETVKVAARYNYRGWQVRPRDRKPEEVAAAVRDALEVSAEGRREIAAACRAWVEERHDSLKIARRLLEVSLG